MTASAHPRRAHSVRQRHRAPTRTWPRRRHLRVTRWRHQRRQRAPWACRSRSTRWSRPPAPTCPIPLAASLDSTRSAGREAGDRRRPRWTRRIFDSPTSGGHAYCRCTGWAHTSRLGWRAAVRLRAERLQRAGGGCGAVHHRNATRSSPVVGPRGRRPPVWWQRSWTLSAMASRSTFTQGRHGSVAQRVTTTPGHSARVRPA